MNKNNLSEILNQTVIGDLKYSILCTQGNLDEFEKTFEKWLSIRHLAIDLINNGKKSSLISEFSCSINQNNDHSNLFLLFHHGTYFMFPYIAIKKMKFSGACFLITRDSFNEKIIEELAKKLEIPFSIEYIDEKGFFVRRSKNYIKQNYAVFLLMDIPHGKDSRSNISYECSFGILLLKNGYLRVVSALKQKITLMISELDLNRKIITVNIVTFKSEEDINNYLHKEYMEKPEMFERLHHLKKFCTFKNKNENFNHKFLANGKKYKYQPKTEKITENV